MDLEFYNMKTEADMKEILKIVKSMEKGKSGIKMVAYMKEPFKMIKK